MDKKLDIFKRLPDGESLWVTAVEGLDEAKRRLAEMVAVWPGEYFIFDSRSGRIIPA